VANDGALPEHVRRNRVRWNAEARNYVAGAERAWAREEPTWGIGPGCWWEDEAEDADHDIRKRADQVALVEDLPASALLQREVR